MAAKKTQKEPLGWQEKKENPKQPSNTNAGQQKFKEKESREKPEGRHDFQEGQYRGQQGAGQKEQQKGKKFSGEGNRLGQTEKQGFGWEKESEYSRETSKPSGFDFTEEESDESVRFNRQPGQKEKEQGNKNKLFGNNQKSPGNKPSKGWGDKEEPFQKGPQNRR